MKLLAKLAWIRKLSLFDTPSQWFSKKNLTGMTFYYFEIPGIDDRRLVVFVNTEPDEKGCEIVFGFQREAGGEIEYEITKDMKPFNIFSSVAAAIFDFVKNHSPELFYFSSFESNIELDAVYKRIAPRLVRALKSKGFDYDYDYQGGDHLFKKVEEDDDAEEDSSAG